MERNPALLNKTLVVGVITLFIGVGIQPAFAVTIDNVDDCKLCGSVSKQHLTLIRNILNRLEFATNFILSKFGDKPEIKEKCEELSIKITKLNEIHNLLISNSWIPGQLTFCILFAILFFVFLFPFAIINSLAELFPLFIPICDFICYAIFWPIFGVLFSIYDEYNCDEIFVFPFPW